MSIEKLNMPPTEWSIGTGIYTGYDEYELSFNGPLTTGFTYDLTINGTPITQVTFSTNNNTTIQSVATNIAAVSAYVNSATVVDQTVSNSLFFRAKTAGVSFVLTGSTVGGSTVKATLRRVTKSPQISKIFVEPPPVTSITSSVESGSTNSPIVAGAKAVTFTTSAGFVGTINGAARSASTTYTFNNSGLLPAIAYTVTGGTMTIDVIR